MRPVFLIIASRSRPSTIIPTPAFQIKRFIIHINTGILDDLNRAPLNARALAMAIPNVHETQAVGVVVGLRVGVKALAVA